MFTMQELEHRVCLHPGAFCWCQVHLQVAWGMRNPSKGLRGLKGFNSGSGGVNNLFFSLSPPWCERLCLLLSTEQTQPGVCS